MSRVVHSYQQYIHSGPLPEDARTIVETVPIREPVDKDDPGLYHTTVMLVSGE